MSRSINKDLNGLCKILLIVLLTAPVSRAQTNAPDIVELDQLTDLYEPVVFDHDMHAELYPCYRCHHHTTPAGTEDEFCGPCHVQPVILQSIGCVNCHAARLSASEKTAPKGQYHIDTPSLKGAMHLLCLNCHTDEGAPADCRDCHEFTERGRQLFRVHE